MLCVMNLTLQYFTIYPFFSGSIIVNQFENMDILCYVMIRAGAGYALMKPARPLLLTHWGLDWTHC